MRISSFITMAKKSAAWSIQLAIKELCQSNSVLVSMTHGARAQAEWWGQVHMIPSTATSGWIRFSACKWWNNYKWTPVRTTGSPRVTWSNMSRDSDIGRAPSCWHKRELIIIILCLPPERLASKSLRNLPHLRRIISKVNKLSVKTLSLTQG